MIWICVGICRSKSILAFPLARDPDPSEIHAYSKNLDKKCHEFQIFNIFSGFLENALVITFVFIRKHPQDFAYQEVAELFKILNFSLLSLLGVNFRWISVIEKHLN